ncbi:MAG: polysaccharide biosynthesis C-terminal domain-containing protein [Sphingobacteriaceae bacterium]|nr:polysaccharide biosynthesis C-terminal domain-containing protein [Sphingobacteriaceae bacterium]
MNKKFTSTIAGASILITSVGLLSRGFGFLREIIFAAYFGLGIDFEIYLIASVIPVTINTVLLYLGQNYYIPIHARIKNEGIKNETELFIRVIISFFLGGIVLGILLFALSDYLLTIYLSGANPAKIKTALIIFRILIITLPLNAAISILSAHLQAQRKFSIPALAQLFTNFSVIIFVPLLSNGIGIVIIPTAYLIGSFVQLIFLIIKIKNTLSLDKSKIFRDSFSHFKIYSSKSLLLIIVIEILGQFYLIIDRYFYDKVEPGGIAALNYAITVYYLPIAILSVALSTAIFPSFSEHLQNKSSEEFVTKVNNSLSVNTFLFSPIFILLFFYGNILIKLFFQRGNFSLVDTQMTFSALQYFSLSVIFYSIYAILNKILYGARLIEHLLIISLIGIIIKLVFNYILVGSMKHNGLALSSSLSYTFICLISVLVLSRKFKIPLHVILGKNAIVSIINSIFSYFITLIIVAPFLLDNFLDTIVRIFLFVAIYLFNAYCLRDHSIFLLKEAWISYKKS